MNKKAVCDGLAGGYFNLTRRFALCQYLQFFYARALAARESLNVRPAIARQPLNMQTMQFARRPVKLEHALSMLVEYELKPKSK